MGLQTIEIEDLDVEQLIIGQLLLHVLTCVTPPTASCMRLLDREATAT